MNNEIATIPETTPNPASSLQPPACRPDLSPCSALTKAEGPGEAGLTIIMATSSSVQPRASRPHIRNGKIARLPKLERDLVNRMLHNHVPYAKIVGALDELAIKATERNISNWKTRGGYKEWCAEQIGRAHV